MTRFYRPLFRSKPSALLVGQDEGYEIIKPYLCNQGYALYTDIWNDQPPVYTKILSCAFKISSPFIFTARIVAVIFGLLLLISAYESMWMRSGSLPATFGTFLLLAAPVVLMLCSSVMLEAPAFAMALLAVWLLFQWGRQKNWGWLMASGLVMAVALQIKLTAALVLPAMGVELLLLTQDKSKRIWFRTALRTGFVWGICLLAVVALIGFTWGKGSLQSSWKSHTMVATVAGFGQAREHALDPELLRAHAECLIAALAAMALAFSQKRLRELSFPLIFLATDVVVHLFHRPWWNYYYLHFAIPVGWLAGWTVAYFVNQALDLNSRPNGRKSAPRPMGKLLVYCAMAALVLARSERRLEGITRKINESERIEGNPILAKMQELHSTTHWVYSEPGIYPFLCQMNEPPELGVVVPKRFWSGQITTSKIIQLCEQYHTGLIILPTKETAIPEWADYLSMHYTQVCSDKENTLYRSNE